jgi:GntR family transcriptional repressor for pyruvate dehydrogenase complex
VANSTAPREGEARPQPAYQVVVEHLRRAIRLGRYLPGETLPPERELAEQLRVSRTTLREASRVLEGEGLIETRRGRNGGMRVLSIDTSPAESRRLLRAQRKEIETVFEFRIAVESAAAALAAERRTKTELRRLESLFGEMQKIIEVLRLDPEEVPPHQWFSVDTKFHMTIAAAARNEMLDKGVADARAAMFEPLGLIFSAIDPHANDAHEEILDAIRRQDRDAAAAAMTRHIEITRDSLDKYLRGGGNR